MLSRDTSGVLIRAEDWELKPNTIVPVELIAPPVLRGEASAVANSAEVAWIGLNRTLPQKLATAPAIEVKTELVTFKLTFAMTG